MKEDRTPDAIVHDGHELVALEVEQVKRCKASLEAVNERLSESNSHSRFFDRTRVLFVEGSDLAGSISKGTTEMLAKD